MSGPADDPELRALFLEEVRRHAAAFIGPADATIRARALHGLRGAAAMMGLSDIAGRLADLEGETRAGDAEAAVRGLPEIENRLRLAGFDLPELRREAVRISSNPPPRVTGDRVSAPVGPRGSDRPSLDPEVLSYFFSEARNRVERLGEVLVALGHVGSAEQLDEAFRHVHAIKGAASTVGLGSIARGAHALESALMALKARARELSIAELDVLSRARGHLSVSLARPETAADESEAMVNVLREAGLVREQELSGLGGLGRDRARESRTVDEIRVPVTTVAALTESAAEVGSVGDRMVVHATAVREYARVVADASRTVQEALQRIGPPRPWGAPADALERLASVVRLLGESSGEMDRESERFGHDAEVLGTLAGGARDVLQRMGASSAKWLFERVAPVAETLARRESKELLVVRAGEDVEIARGVAEQLVEPLAQLVRNAVTHGVEQPSTRLSRGKPARASLRLEASVHAGRLRILVEDDGAGVDLESAAQRAIALGLLTEAQARSPGAVLATLFMPGVSTRVKADTAAGRGIGLDLVYREVTHLGGEISVTSQRGKYTRFAIEITLRPPAQRMLVVRVAASRLALPLERVVRVVGSVADAHGVPILRLAQALGLPGNSQVDHPTIVLVQRSAGVLGVEVDEVERAREFVMRPLPALIAGLRPWAAATVDGEGRVIPVIDVEELLPSHAR